LIVAIAARKELPSRRAVGGAVIYGLLSFGLAYAFLYVAILDIGAGTTSVVMAGVPLMTLLLAVAHRQERLSLRGMIGGVLAIGGIGVLSLDRIGGDLPILPLLFAVGGALAAAEATVLLKSFPKADPIIVNGIGMTVGAAALIVTSFVLSEPKVLPETAKVWGALIWLVGPGSIGLFVTFLYLVRKWTASASAYSLTLMPLVAITLGALFASEVITIQVIGGGLLVVLGVYVGALMGASRRGRELKPPLAGEPAGQES
jgi:drug/metabolite transporter (DMT)-like permease